MGACASAPQGMTRASGSEPWSKSFGFLAQKVGRSSANKSDKYGDLISSGDAADRSAPTDVTLKYKKHEMTRQLKHAEKTLGYPRNFDEYFELGQMLGKGAFGEVFDAVPKVDEDTFDDADGIGGSTNRPFYLSPRLKDRKISLELAVKIIPKKTINTVQELVWLSQEVQMMYMLRNSLNIVQVYGVYEDDAKVYIIVEKCAGGNLFDRILSGKTYNEKIASELCADILRVAEQCHERGVIHRDIKPENFLFCLPPLVKTDSQEEDCIGLPPLKMTDFGLAEKYTGKPLTEISGTPHYMAPEVIRQKYGPAADLWSCGAVLYVLLSGRAPFHQHGDTGFRQVFVRILNHEPNYTMPPWDGISDQAKDLCQKLLTKDPRKRITAAQALEHPWIADESVAPTAALADSVVQHLQLFGSYAKLKQIALMQASAFLIEDRELKRKTPGKVADKSGVASKEGDAGAANGKAGNAADPNGTSETHAACVDSATSIQRSDTGKSGFDEISLTESLRKFRSFGHKFCGHDVEELGRLFDQLDEDKSGYINANEMHVGLWRVGYSLSDTEILAIMAQVDVDGDGKLSRPEFVTAMLEWNQMQDLEEWKHLLRRVFDCMDKDGDGVISLDEVRSCMPGQHSDMSVYRALAEVDIDKSGTISRAEFDAMMNSSASLEMFDKRLSSRYARSFHLPADTPKTLSTHYSTGVSTESGTNSM